MLPKVANHLFLHTSRAVTLVQNQSGALRNVLQSGPAAGAGSSWGSTGAGAGPGGAKFHAGSKFYKGYTGAGRAITQANSSTTQDGATKPDDEKEDTKATLVTTRKAPRTLARRHSLSLPAGLNEHERVGASVLQTVQMHLRERHAAAAATTKDQQGEITSEQEPRPVTAWSPFCLALEEALSKDDTPAVLKHVQWLLDASTEPSLSYSEPTILDFNHALRSLVTLSSATSAMFLVQLYNAFLQRGLTPNLGTYISMITGLTDRDREVQKALEILSYYAKRRQLTAFTEADAVAAEQFDEQRRATLLAEDHFATAMKIFDAACVSIPQPTSDSTTALRTLAAHLPISVYHGLLRSCAAHADVDAAIRIYAQLEARSRPPPTDLVFYYLLSTYVNAGDLTGAKEVFREFRDLSARGLVVEIERQYQVRIWNKMIQGHFKAGQPAGALRLLETMMDSGSAEKGGLASIPSPASSTFTTIISGFCNPSPSSDVANTPPKPDIKTALSWFDRLLQQTVASRDVYEPTRDPSRPDQICWSVMLDALLQASSEQSAYLGDLNRLYDVLVECAPKDGLGVKVTDSLMVLEANLPVLEGFAKSRASVVTTSEAEEARHFVNFLGRHVRRVADQLRPVKPGKSLLKYKASITKILAVYLETIASISSPTLAMEQTLPLIPVVRWLGVPVAPLISRPLLRVYMSAPQRLAAAADHETILLCALSLPVHPSSSDIPPFPDCAYTGLMPLLQAMSDVRFDFRLVSSKTQVALTEALYSNHTDVSRFLDGLEWTFHRIKVPFAERAGEQSDFSRSPTPPLPPADFPPPPEQIIIDAELSRQIDRWFPSHPSVTVNDSYTALQASISAKTPRYPHPATLGRLINGLGRASNIAAAQSVYSIAQQVLFSPFVAQSPTWQSQAWFQIEDNMIIAYAHGGDMDTAFAHRNRITAAGGVPSADAYGSLIECVKDTTDDTSNAMALFAECQMLGTKPNVYLYNTIISKLAKARKADFALELFQQMKANTSLRPSSITYGAVIAACARVGDAVAAEQLFEEMAGQPNFKPRIPPYNTMMQLYTHTKPDREKVLFFLNMMTEANVQPSAHTYKLLIDAYGTIEPVDVGAMEATFKSVESNPRIRLQGSHWAALINAHGCVLKDLDKAVSIFESISSHPSSRHGPTPLPDSVAYESLINVLVMHKRMDLAQQYLARLQATDVHMTAYIANLLIKGYTADGAIEQARAIFESLADPPSGVAASGNHVPHDSTSSAPAAVSPDSVSYREPSTWEAMFRAELGNGDRDRAVALLERLKQRQFPEAVNNRIRGIMLDDTIAPWGPSPSQSQQESLSQSPSP